MATPSNPLQQKQSPSNSPSTMDMLVGGIPAAQSDAGQSALAMMLGPGSGLGNYLKVGGPEYADQLDEMEWNPMSVWY